MACPMESTGRTPSLIEFFGHTIRRRVGFPVRLFYFEDKFGSHSLSIQAGRHSTLLEFAAHVAGRAFSDSAVTVLIGRAIKDLQMQVHGYNDFQRAIAIMAEEAQAGVAVPHEPGLFDGIVWYCSDSLQAFRGGLVPPVRCGSGHLGTCIWRGPFGS